MRFPRVCASKSVSVNVGRKPKLSTSDIELPMSIEEIDMNILQNIVGFTEDTVSTKNTASHAMVCDSSKYLKCIWSLSLNVCLHSDT